MTKQAAPLQQAIHEEIRDGNGNIVVRAVAGSGKTTTTIGALPYIPKTKDVLMLAFNRDIAAETTNRIPKEYFNVISKTLHGLGSTAMKKRFNSNLTSDKYRTLVNTMMPYWNLPIDSPKEDYRSRVLKLIDLARLDLATSVTDVEALAEKHDILLSNGECAKAMEMIELGSKNTDQIDYTDMIYLPVRLKVKVRQFDFVFIDECQDLSKCQRELMLMHIKPGGRFCAVGDSSQTIYGFAGADIESYKALCALPNTKEMPLSVTYRCCKAVVRRAQEIVPEIQWADGAPEGVENLEATFADVREGDMMLCRNTFPLVKVCMAYLLKGIKATIQGKDIGQGLINMVERTNTKNTSLMLDLLNKDLQKAGEKLKKKRGLADGELDEDPTYVALKEKVMVIEFFAKHTKSVDDIIAHINNIFADKAKEGIKLSTAHRSKGLEADRVFILSPDLMPAKYAKLAWMKEQEMNLKYVAITRAKTYLGWIEYDAYDKKKKNEAREDSTVQGAAMRIAENSTYGAPGKKKAKKSATPNTRLDNGNGYTMERQ